MKKRWRMRASASICCVALAVLPAGCSRSCTDDVDPANPNSCSYGQYPDSTAAPALEGLLISNEVQDDERRVYEMEVSFENEGDSSLELPNCLLHPNRNQEAPLRWIDDAPVEAGQEVTRTGIVRFGKPVRSLKHAYFGCKGGLVRADKHG